MDEKMYSISCDAECGFMVKSHDKNEVMEITRKHAKEVHKMDVSDKDLEEKIKTDNM